MTLETLGADSRKKCLNYTVSGTDAGAVTFPCEFSPSVVKIIGDNGDILSWNRALNEDNLYFKCSSTFAAPTGPMLTEDLDSAGKIVSITIVAGVLAASQTYHVFIWR